jgi:hypothetical protein
MTNPLDHEQPALDIDVQLDPSPARSGTDEPWAESMSSVPPAEAALAERLEALAIRQSERGKLPDVPHPIDWMMLDAEEAEAEWLDLNAWVEWLRHRFVLSAAIVPPYWHRHWALVEHISALHTHFLGAFDPDQHGSAPFGWLRDFGDWCLRIREVVATIGTRLDADRPDRPVLWPGEPANDAATGLPHVNLSNRYEDFVAYVIWDVTRRKAEEDAYLAQRVELADSQHETQED